MFNLLKFYTVSVCILVLISCNEISKNEESSSIAEPTATNNPPVIEAGEDQTVFIGEIVNLNGAESFDPDGDSIEYFWEFITTPQGSTADLNTPETAIASFTPDIVGIYELRLSVSDGLLTNSTATTITVLGLDGTLNNSPISNAGVNQVINLGEKVHLDGSESLDFDDDILSFIWEVKSKPIDSVCSLNNTQSIISDFTPDLPGKYEIGLTVFDGISESTDIVEIIVLSAVIKNHPPIAVCEYQPQIIFRGDVVELSAASSSDLDTDPLSYSWLLESPGESNATISLENESISSFTADEIGTYIVTLEVSDGIALGSDQKSIVVVNRAPLASINNNSSDFLITPSLMETVDLDASMSSDPDSGDILSYDWEITSKPAESSLDISDPSLSSQSLSFDTQGSYSLQLTVTDGIDFDSVSVIVFTGNPSNNQYPVADAGKNRMVLFGEVVELNAEKSTDPDGDLLTYFWSFYSVPSESYTLLSDETSPQSSFLPDQLGVYYIDLTVSDGIVSGRDRIKINVTNSLTPVNEVPVVILPPDIISEPGELIVLDGSFSYDPEDSPLLFQWEIVTQPVNSNTSLYKDDSSISFIEVDSEGVYEVRLTVTDGVLTSSSILTINCYSPGTAGTVRITIE